MNCKHVETLTYSLMSSDVKDFTKRLDERKKESDHGLGVSFLTPNMRSNRAKSMLATTKTSTSGGGGTSGSKLFDIETDCEFPSGDHRRSSVRKRKPLCAPTKFQNCTSCGALYFRENCVAVKPRQYCFRLETIPSALLCSFFKLQSDQKKVWLHPAIEVDDPYGQQLYLNGRKRIIDGVYKMGVKFQQARETIHIAIEIIDQYYLYKSQVVSSVSYKEEFMHPRQVILHQVTALLLASKYDEVDDNITAIRDLRSYITGQLQQLGKRDTSLVPTFAQIIECEKQLLDYFEWNLRFMLPLHFIRLQLANGILFSNELKFIQNRLEESELIQLKQELTRALTTEALSLSDLLISKGACFLRKEQPSDIAAAIIYFARKNILFSDQASKVVKVPSLWPDELIILTRCTEAQIKKLLSNPLEETYSVDPFSTQASAQIAQESGKGHGVYRSVEPKRESEPRIGSLTSPSSVLKSSLKASMISNTEVKADRIFFMNKNLTKKPIMTAQVKTETTQQSDHKSLEPLGSGSNGILAAKNSSVKQFEVVSKPKSLRQQTFQANLMAASMQQLRCTKKASSSESMGAMVKTPIQQTSSNKMKPVALGQVSIRPSASQAIQALHPIQEKTFQNENRKYIPQGITVGPLTSVAHKNAARENDRSVGEAKDCRSQDSLATAAVLELVHEGNASLPEINSNSSQRQAIYETMGKQNLKASLAIGSSQKDFNKKGRHQISQNSIGSMSQAPLSSSKRPQNQIGFADHISRQIADKKASKSKRVNSNNSNQITQTTRQSSKAQKEIDLNRNNHRGTQKILCLPQNQITVPMNEQVPLAPHSTRNNYLSRKGSNQVIKKPSVGFKNDLPQVVSSTPNSNEYFGFKSHGSRVKSTSKIGIVDEAQGVSIDFLSGRKPLATLHNAQSSESLGVTQIVQSKLYGSIKPQPLISPPVKNAQTSVKQNPVIFRGSQNLQSVVTSLNQPPAAFKQLQAHQQSYKRSGSQEAIASKREVSPIKTVSLLHQNDSGESNKGQKLAELDQNQLKKESPGKRQKLPRLGSLSQPQLKENDHHMGNVPAQIKTRQLSEGPSGILSNAANHHGTMVTKTTRIDRKNKDQKVTQTLSMPSPALDSNPASTKNKSQYFGGKLKAQRNSQYSSSSQIQVVNQQRLVSNALRKGPSFAGMSQIATPSGGDESMKNAVQNSHRVLTKGSSQRQIKFNTNGINQQAVHQQSINKFAKNAAKSGRNTNNLRSQKSNNAKAMRQNFGATAALAQSQANISQTLVQVAATSAINSKTSSVMRSAQTSVHQTVSNSVAGDKLANGVSIHRRAHASQSQTNLNVNQQHQSADQPQRGTRQVVKNRNHNAVSNLAGVVPLHGLINANFTSLSKASVDLKGSFQSLNYQQVTKDHVTDNLSPDLQQSKTTLGKLQQPLRSIKNQIRQ